MGAVSHLTDFPNDKYMWFNIPSPTPEDIPELVRRLKEKPSPVLMKCLIPFLGSKDFPDATQAVKELGAEALSQLIDQFPSLDSRTRIINPGYEMIEEAWDRIRALSREKLVSIHDMKDELKRIPIPQNLLPNREITAIVPLKDIKKVYDEKVADSEKDSPSINTGTSLRDVDVSVTVENVTDNPLLNELIDGNPLGMGFCGTYALAVPFKIDWAVDLDGANYRVKGKGGVSGKGLTHETVTASGFMELAERVSAIAGATPNWPEGYVNIDELVRGRLTELQSQGLNVLDPNSFTLPIPYVDQQIYWVKGQIKTEDGEHDIYVPVQKAFHFSNLDEQEILKDSSNGLASGNTIEEAKLHALLEIFERDGCYTTFTSQERIFTLPEKNDDKVIGDIMARYRAKGLQPAFVDLTTDFGIPAYKAFVQLEDGTILSGSGAHLDGKIALIRAICELSAKCIGYVRSFGGDLTKTLKTLKPNIREMTEIPNLSTGSVDTDLKLLEVVLIGNGFPPTYVDLTKEEIGIPVVRAIIPELDHPFNLTKRGVRHFLEESKTQELSLV
ncbi:YcaO-like family protein [Candidatus Roizmanbacteria bacterium]|nr:YcaO-like family protein [Candidatus Roizmanbacteria bacterium]